MQCTSLLDEGGYIIIFNEIPDTIWRRATTVEQRRYFRCYGHGRKNIGADVSHFIQNGERDFRLTV